MTNRSLGWRADRRAFQHIGGLGHRLAGASAVVVVVVVGVVALVAASIVGACLPDMARAAQQGPNRTEDAARPTEAAACGPGRTAALQGLMEADTPCPAWWALRAW